MYLDNAVISGSNGEDDGGGKNIDIRLYDIERIEVLRGPQGTLYGAGSLSGTIRMITNQPKLDRVEGSFGAELSDTQHSTTQNYNVNGMINIPLVKDKFAIRAVGWHVSDSGYIDNIRLNDKGVNNEENRGRAVDGVARGDRPVEDHRLHSLPGAVCRRQVVLLSQRRRSQGKRVHRRIRAPTVRRFRSST